MSPTIFEPRLALNFAAVVREGSITAAARALGVAQPWVSEQVRKLEIQMGEKLLIRTSRRMELTDAGARFLPLAEALATANDAAQRFAAEARAHADREIRIGATDFTIGLEERVWLIDRVMARNPRSELQIAGGKPARLIEQLLAGDIDIAMVHISPGLDTSALAWIGLGPRYAHVVVPPGDALAAADAIPIEALSGRQIAISPGRSDASARSAALEPLRAYGVEFVPAPDEDRQSIATFAARQRILCFWYYREQRERHVRGTQPCIPIVGHPLRTQLAVYRRRDDVRGKITRFWSATEELAAEIAGTVVD